MKTIFIFLLLLPASLYAQGLQGPFVPIEVTNVQNTGNGSVNVSMLYEAPATGGGSVYGEGTINMTNEQLKQQAVDRANAPNGTGVKQQLSDLGMEVNGAELERPTDEEDPPAYSFIGTCRRDQPPLEVYQASLGICLADLQSAVIQEEEFSWVGAECHESGGFITAKFLSNGATFRIGTWTATVGAQMSDICPNGGEDLPDPVDTEPVEGDDLSDQLSGQSSENPSNPPEPLPEAPNPPSAGEPPPLYNPDFYRQPDSEQFDLELPSTPTLLVIQQQMTADYDNHTNTQTVSSSLPIGLSYTRPPSGNTANPYTRSGSTAPRTSAGGDDEGGGLNLCDTNPSALACVDTNVGEEVIPDIELTTVDLGTVLTPVSLSSATGCPAPQSIGFLGDTIDISYDVICDFGNTVNPLFQIISLLSAGMIILGIRGTGT